MRIVVFDSDQTFLDQFTQRCQKSGVQCLVFSDVNLAFGAVQKSPELVDVVLISREIGKQEELGFELTRKLRGESKTADVPFIVLSGVLLNSDFAKHQKGTDGANAYLKKPAPLKNLIETIEAVTGVKFPAEQIAAIPKKAPLLRPLTPGVNIVLLETAQTFKLMERAPTPKAAAKKVTFFEDESPVNPQNMEILKISGTAAAVAQTPAPVTPPEVPQVAEPSAVSVEPVLEVTLAKESLEVVPSVAEAAPPLPPPLPATPTAETSSSESGGIEISNTEDSLELQLTTSGVQSPEQVEAATPSAPPSTPTPVSDELSIHLDVKPSDESLSPQQGFTMVGAASEVATEGQPVVAVSITVPQSEGVVTQQEAAPVATSSASSAQEVSDEEAAQELPYLFGGGLGNATVQQYSTELSRSMPSAALTLAGSASASGSSEDVETLKKYLMMREQDLAILSAQLSYAKEELGKSEQNIKRATMQAEDLVHQLDDRKQRIESLEQELMHIGKSKEGELEQLRFEVKSKIDRIKFLEDQMANSSVQYEKLKERVRQDIRKIRVREKELENKLEILKKDSETLIAGRESKILELKRKIDLLEFNYDTLQDQNEAEKTNVARAHEKIAKVVKVLKLAMGIIEGETEHEKNKDDLGVNVA